MLPSLMVGCDAFNLISIGGIGGFHRVCVYISLMTSGEFVRFYSESVCWPGLSGASKGIWCAAYFGQYFRIIRIIDFLDFNL